MKHGSTNLIKEPTCHKGKVSTLLDVILVTNRLRYLGVLNSPCCVSDFHNIIGAATRRFSPLQKPQNILYRSYKHFNDANFLFDIQSAPFRVVEIFDNADDMAWYTSTLIRDVIDTHAKLVKAIYSRNMARNKFRKFGTKFWSENRRQRNKVVALRNKSMSIYFDNKCRKQDESFWQSISPFFSDKKFGNGNNIILRENGNTIIDSKNISGVFNDYFLTLSLILVSAMSIFLPAKLLLFIKITRV